MSEGRYSVRCLSRRPEAVRQAFGEMVDVAKGDANDVPGLLAALEGVDVAYYLIHSMEGPSSQWERFPERDRAYAQNFAEAATKCGVKRIIYLGGLTQGEEEDISMHMRSRREVGEILKTSKARVTVLRAAVILGAGSASFEMMAQLVDNLPFMVCPRWVLRKVQPIAVDDVISYLAGAMEDERTSGRTFDIAGQEVLTYREMMNTYARVVGKRFGALMLPFLSLRLSSYWVDLVTDVRASLAYPLIESLSKDSTSSEDSIKGLLPFRTKTVEEAIRSAVSERRAMKAQAGSYKVLEAASLAIFALLATFPLWQSLGLAPQSSIPVSVPLLTASALAAFFAGERTRLGALLAGAAGWGALAIWLADLYVGVVAHPDQISTVIATRDAAGIALSLAAIPFSHVVFHKETGAR